MLQPYEIWTDKSSNRLHLVLRQMLTDKEINQLLRDALLAGRALRHGFTINISHEPSDILRPPHPSARQYVINRLLHVVNANLRA